jgi:hypothetical protein
MKSNDHSSQLVKVTIVFVLLAVAGVGMAAAASVLADTSADQAILINVGSAIFGGALAFFLVEMFRWAREG